MKWQTDLIPLLRKQFELAILGILTQMALLMIHIDGCSNLRFLVYGMLFGFSPVYFAILY